MSLLDHQVVVGILDNFQLLLEYFTATFEFIFFDGEALDRLILSPALLIDLLLCTLSYLTLRAGEVGRTGACYEYSPEHSTATGRLCGR